MYNIFNVIWFELIWFAWYDLKRDWRGSIWFYCGGFSHEKGLEDQSWRVNHMGLGIWWQLTQLTQLRQWQVGGWIIEATNHIPKWIDPVLKHGFLVFNSHIAHSPMIFAFFAHHYTMELWQFSPWLHEKTTEAVAAHWICFHVPNVGGGHRLIHQMMVFHMGGVRFS